MFSESHLHVVQFDVIRVFFLNSIKSKKVWFLYKKVLVNGENEKFLVWNHQYFEKIP